MREWEEVQALLLAVRLHDFPVRLWREVFGQRRPVRDPAPQWRGEDHLPARVDDGGREEDRVGLMTYATDFDPEVSPRDPFPMLGQRSDLRDAQ